MKDSSQTTTELLLDQVSWLRALARSLVRDAALADDLVQEAVVVALERPPRDATSLRAWLARVLRSKVRAERRSSEARRSREKERVAPSAEAGGDELVERLHLQREIADELLELEEPYRSTVLLRFYEDLPPREIARRQEVPVATVKSRLHRGLARLRERLDERHGGDRGTWVLALLPLARDPLWTAAAAVSGAKGLTPAIGSLGGIAVNTKLILAALTIVVLGGTWFVSRDGGREGSALKGSLASVPSSIADPGGLAVDVPDEPTSRAEARTAIASEPESNTTNETGPSTVASVFVVQGRVVDAEARPIDGLEVQVEGSAGETAVSSNGGRILLETKQTSIVLDVADDEWVAVRKGVWSAGGSLDPFIVCAPAVRIGGRVVEETGAAIAGARVVVVLPAALQSRMQDVPDASIQMTWKGWSGDDGAFLFEEAPLVPGTKLLVAKDGFFPELVEDSERGSDRMEIVLRRLTESEGLAIAGRVVLPDGTPASEARLALGVGSVLVDEEGFFSMGLEKALDTDRIIAAQLGYQSVMMERPGEPEDELFGWPSFLELVLGPEPLAIRGRLVDHLGEPCEGAYVWIEDPTPFGTLGTHPLHIESWSAGGRVPQRAIDSIAQVPDQDGDEAFGSATPIGEPNAMLFWVRTDPDGGFEVAGLLDREYTLRAIDSELRWNITSQVVAAGTSGFEFRVPRPDVYEQLEAKVVTRHGDPVAGVRVLQWTAAMDKETRVFGGRSHITRFLMGPSTVSDENGRLSFDDVPKERIDFYIASDEILPAYASIEDIEDPENVEIVVAARAYLNVVAEPADAVDSIFVTDVEGQRQKILLMRADGYSNYDDYPLTEGRSGVVTVTSDAALLHLVSEGQVIETLPLILRPGEVERIDFKL